MDNKTAINAEFHIKSIEGKIRGLAKRLFKLAPSPANAQSHGPLFISFDNAYKPAADYDGMLGSIIAESFIGSAFSDAANDLGTDIDTIPGASNFDQLIEAASEYLESKEKDKNIEIKGKGTFALGNHKTICNTFKDKVEAHAFTKDLEERSRLEAAIAAMMHDLNVFKRDTFENTIPAPVYA